MKNFIFGLILGVGLSALVAYNWLLPQTKQTSYDAGYAVGNQKGMTDGVIKGKEEGVAEGLAQQKEEQAKLKDSLDQVIANKQEALRKATRKQVDKKPEIENWHVIGGNIAEPIVNVK